LHRQGRPHIRFARFAMTAPRRCGEAHQEDFELRYVNAEAHKERAA
jgi:hypothetical protein